VGVLYKLTPTVNGNPYAFMGPGFVAILRTPTWLGRLFGKREGRAKFGWNDTDHYWYFKGSGDRVGALLSWTLTGIVARHRSRIAKALQDTDEEARKQTNWEEV